MTGKNDEEKCADGPHTEICPKGQDICPIYSEVEMLRHQVKTDPLTGLFNLRQLRDILDQELERTRRSAQPTTLIMLDIDHFKRINDTHGHILGDKVLQHLAWQFNKALRKLDTACRYGGEEFAIVLPSTHLLMGIKVAERLRHAIATMPLRIADTSYPVTVSMGVDSYTQQCRDSPDDFICRVDQKLYKAKQCGRNCVQHGVEMNDTAQSDVKLPEKAETHL